MSENICKDCADYGFVAWFPANGPQGPGKAIVPPENHDIPAKMLIFEACSCTNGQNFYIIKE